MQSTDKILADIENETNEYLSQFNFSGDYNKEKVLEILSKRVFNGQPIKTYVVDSPSLEVVMEVLKDGLRHFGYKNEKEILTKISELSIYNCIWGYYQMIFWDIAYSKCKDQSHEFGRQKFRDAVVNGLGYYINLGCLAIGIMRPVACQDPEKRIHKDNGPAIIWGDIKQYWWHGVQVPNKWIENKNETSPKEVLANENSEVRRAGCEILGWENVLKELEAKVISKDEFGELLEVNLPEAPDSKFIKVLCGTGRTFVLPVPKGMKTAHEAVAWSYNLDITDYKPEVRT